MAELVEKLYQQSLKHCARIGSQGGVRAEQVEAKERVGGSTILPDDRRYNTGRTNNDRNQCPPT